MNNFINNWDEDLKLAQKAIPIQNAIYNNIFQIKNIKRFSKDNDFILDTHYHIDVELELKNGIKLLGQEKALRYQFSNFNTFTIEFFQNRFTREKGEFFNLGAQFYLHGYFNDIEDKFEKWYLIKIFDFLTYLKKTPIEILEESTKPTTHSNASFYYIDYGNIPINFIYTKKCRS